MAPQNGLPGSVDIINQKTGNVIAQYAHDSDRVVNLTDTSIVRINASPESVNFYERQGNDLIVHMKDGTTVRYQNFFNLDAEGLHSQLVFEDSLGTHHAVFSDAVEAGTVGAAGAETIAPTFTEVAMDSLIGASGISAMAVLGGIAAVGGIVGIAAAGGGGGGGGSNDSGGNTGGGNTGGGNTGGGNTGGGNTGGGDTGGGTDPGDGGTDPGGGAPVLRLAVIGNNNMLNSTDILTPQTISGTTDEANAGGQITITSGDYTWTTVVGSDGSWLVFLPPSLMANFEQGNHDVTVTLTTLDGTTTTETTQFWVDTVPPVLDLTAFAPNNIVGLALTADDKLVRGYSSVADEGSQVTVTLNGKTYTTTVDANGQWQLTIPQADMALLQDGQNYTLTYRVVDLAGNVTQEQSTVTTNFSTPDLTIDQFAGDNVINSAEVLLSQTLSGHTVNVSAGQIVTITLNSKTYYAEVGGDGSWKVIIPAGDLGALSQGTNTLTASVTDINGVTVVRSDTVTVDTTQPGIAIAILSSDDYLSAAEAEQPLEVRGVTTVTGAGVTITVNVNGKDYEVTNIDESGYWSVIIPSSDLLQLSDGQNVIIATVTQDDNFAQDQHTLNVLIHHLPQPIINEPFGDGYLNSVEKTTAQTLSGNTGVSGGGQHVTVTVGGKIYQATVDGDGNWKITVPVGDLQTFPDGQLAISVSATDASGNAASIADIAQVDTLAPALTVLPLTSDDKLNLTELGQDQVLNGISATSERGQTVTVTLNGKTYTTVVGDDGNWQVTLPSADLELLGNGAHVITVSLSDAAGNTTTITHNVDVKTTALTLTVQDFTDGNALNAAEVKVDQTLHGSTNAEAGSVVTLSLGGMSYTGVVDALGNWQIVLPAVELQKFTDGTQTYSISVTDAYGQTQTVNSSFGVDTTTDAVAISILSGDDYLNQVESGSDLTVRGSSAGLPEGTIIVVTLNNKVYVAAVNANGGWEATISSLDLALLSDGTNTVTASATTASGTVTDSHSFNVIIHNLPQLQVDQPFVDGTVNLAESSQNQVLTGQTNVSGAGQTVVATLNGQQYIGVVQSDGSWSVTLPAGAMQSLPSAPGTITVDVTDAAGNTSSQTVAFNVDKTPPTVTVSPVNGNDVLNAANVQSGQTVSINASADTASVVLTLNGVAHAATLSGGVWQVSLSATDLGALSSGTTSYTVTATDVAGNSTTITRAVTLDTTAPNVVIDPVTHDNQIDIAELNSGINLTGKTVPADPGSVVTININGATVTGTVGADGTWSVPVSSSVLSGMSNGTYLMSVVVTDPVGNSSGVQTVSFTVNTTSSAIAVNPVESDDKISAADISDGLTISGITARVADGTTVTVTLNGKQYTTQVDVSGNWQLTISQADAAAIADGTATLTVTTRDVDNLPVSSERQFTIITHQLPQPAINIPFTDGILNAAEATAGGTLSGITGSKGSGQTVTITLDSGTPLTATVDANGNWSLALTPTQLGSLSPGNHTITVTATDAAGNQSSSTTALVVDTQAPTLGINSVTSDNIVNTVEVGGALNITGTGSYDPLHAQTVKVLVNGQNYDAILQPDGTWSIALPAGALSNVPDGPVTVTATITDYAGNTTTTSSSFTLDASAVNAPLVQINKVAGDDFVSSLEGQSALTISGTTTRVEDGRTVTVTLNGQTYTTQVSGGTWSVLVPQGDVAAVPDGSQVISVSVSDISGNTASASHSTTFVTHAASQPTLIINSVAQDDVINALEHNQSLDITGTSTHLAAGTVVTVTLNAKTYTGTVDSSGNWKITVPQVDVQNMSDSTIGSPYYEVSASAQDAATNPASATHNIVVDTTGPTLTVTTQGSILSDGFINIAEASVDQIVTGVGTPGQTVKLDINGTTLVTSVGDTGNWSMTIPSGALQSLGQSSTTLVFYSTDAQGNTTPAPVTVSTNTTIAPTITLGAMYTNNIVSATEAATLTTLTGTATGLADGTIVNVTIGLQTFSGSVNGGVWTVDIGANQLNASGQLAVTVSAVDAWNNPATVNSTLDVILTPPTATLPATLFGDNYLSQAEANAGTQLSGLTGQVGPGQTVNITIDGTQNITGTVDVNGNWSVALTPAQLNALTDGSHTLTVTVTDRAGNSTTSDPASTFNVLTDPLIAPQLTAPFSDGLLNATETTSQQTISGQLNTDAANVASVTVSLNNGTPVTATINGDGTWSLNLSPTVLAALPDGTTTVSVTVTDKAGNIVTGQGTFDVLTHNLPVATFSTPFGDGTINYAEMNSDQVITGNTGVTGAGQTVQVTFNGHTYNQTVGINGEWSVTIPQADMADLVDGNLNEAVTATVTDRANNVSTTVTVPVSVHATLPDPTAINLFGGDGILNIAEAAGPLTLTGTTGITNGNNQYVTVQIDIGGVTYTAGVVNGVWTVNLPAGALQSLDPSSSHAIIITAEDQYGNSNSESVGFAVAFTPPTVQITSSIFGDGYVNSHEYSVVGTELSGTFTTAAAWLSGTTVKVTIGSQTFDAQVSGNTWTLSLDATQWLSVVERGLQNVVVTVVDGGLNSGTTSAPVVILLTQPTVDVTHQFAGDGELNYLESQTAQTISGTSTNLQAGDTVRVTFTGDADSNVSHSFDAVVQADGSWSLQISPADMATLQAGTVTVLGIDKAGNTGSATGVPDLTIDLTLPDYAVVMDPVTGDNLVNATEFVNGSVTITGHSLNLVGTQITLFLQAGSGSPVELTTVTVQSDGSWSFSLPQGLIPDGTWTISATSVSQPATPEVSQTFTVDTIPPTLTVNQFTGDNVVNSDEKATAQTITGTSDANGSQIVVTLNGNTYYAIVDNGTWSVQVSQTDMAALSGNSATITATVRDAAGNQTQQSQTFTIDTTAPLLQVNTLSIPAVLNTVNAASGLVVQGQGDPNTDVTITLGPLSWTAHSDANGNWSYTFPQVNLLTLTDGPQVISITSSDSAGNVSSNTVSLNVALNKTLGVAINQVFNDGILNVAESLVTQTLTGQVSGDYRGAKVSLTIAGANFTINNLAVGTDGSYSFQLPPSIWQGLINQTLTARVDVVDANGNTTYQTIDFNLALTDLPVVGNVLVAVDNVINQAESTVDQVISGTVSSLANLANTAAVVVSFGGRTVTATVTAVGDGTGRWVATLPSSILSTLPDGLATVNIAVTDKYGNVVNSSSTINIVTHNLPTITLDPLFTDGTLSISELTNALLSGTSTGLANGVITVLLSSGQTFTTNADGNGHWSVNLSTIVSALQALGTGNVSVTVTASDQYGNPASQTGQFKLDLVAPVISNVVAFGDGLLNVADSLLNQTITGVVSNAPLGSTVEVVIGTKTFTGTVAANGTFTINLTPANLAGLLDGTFTPQIKVTTPDGNVGTAVGTNVTIGLTNLPSVAITSLFGNDGWLNHAEATAAQTISGTVTGTTTGTVTVTIGSTPYLVPVSNGTWSLQLSAGALASIADGSLKVTASVTDAVGNTVSGSQVVGTIVQAVPSITLGTLFGNGVLDLVDLLTNPILSGTSTNLAVGTQITVTVGGLSFTTTVGAGGAWQIPISAVSLQGLTDGTNNLQVSVTATDVAGNVATASKLASVSIQATPTVAITSLFGDGGLSLADLSVDQKISGTSANAIGSTLTVTLGTKSYTATVAADGTWSVTVPKADLSLLADGQPTVSVSVTNTAGHTASTSGLLDVITHNLPSVTLNPLFGGDGLLNISEAASGQTITGKITGVVSGAKVVVTVGGVQLNATVAADGTWSAAVSSNILKSLSTGTVHIGVAVTDQVGNTTATSVDVGVKFTQPTMSLNALSLAGLLSLVGALLTPKYLTLSGTSTNLEQGSTINVNLLNTVNATAKTNADGTWSTQVYLTVDLLAILSLSTVVHLSASDTAGNMGYLNVGLGGGNPTTTAPVSTMSVEATSFSVLAASTVEASDTTTSTDSSDSTTTHTSTTTTSTTDTTSGTTSTETYTIGGLSIDLADGTHQSGDTVHGGTGNDTIHLSTLGFTLIDGGEGTDTLVLDGANMILNLIDAATKVQHIEIIDLGKSGTNTVTLDLNEALTITDKPDDDLIIKGTTGDQINLKHGTDDVWAISGQRDVDGVQFDIYHNSSQTNTLGDVLIQHGLHVNMV